MRVYVCFYRSYVSHYLELSNLVMTGIDSEKWLLKNCHLVHGQILIKFLLVSVGILVGLAEFF